MEICSTKLKNIGWLKKNLWFEKEVVPTLKEIVTKIMKN